MSQLRRPQQHTRAHGVRRSLLASGLALLLPWAPAQAQIQTQAADAAPEPAEGDVLLYRHAIAPGGGDPAGWRLGDCSSQRNLDDIGRQQARRIGEALRARGLRPGALWASPWCRTQDTAALAFPGQAVVTQPAFGSFFDEPAHGDAQTRQAQALLHAWRTARPAPGLLMVVTHQVNITALTGIHPASGEGVVLRWRDSRWQVAGRIAPP